MTLVSPEEFPSDLELDIHVCHAEDLNRYLRSQSDFFGACDKYARNLSSTTLIELGEATTEFEIDLARTIKSISKAHSNQLYGAAFAHAFIIAEDNIRVDHMNSLLRYPHFTPYGQTPEAASFDDQLSYALSHDGLVRVVNGLTAGAVLQLNKHVDTFYEAAATDAA